MVSGEKPSHMLGEDILVSVHFPMGFKMMHF